MKPRYYFFDRMAFKGCPAGVTVSKNASLPEGDFAITEFTWQSAAQYAVLWFVDGDTFTASEREDAKNQRLGL